VVGLLAALALPASARANPDVVELDPATDTVRVAGKLDGTLTGPAAGAAAPIGLRWVRAHRAQLGLTLADLETLGEPTVRSEGGIRQVRWRQGVDGVPVADADLRVNVDERGRLINVLGSPSSDLPSDTTPRLPKPVKDAELTIYENRLAYRYLDGDHDTVVDADSGATLRRQNLVKSALARVWDNHPSLIVPAKSFDLAVWQTEPTRLRNQWMHVYADDALATGDVVPGDYSFQSFLGDDCTDARPCSWDGTTRPGPNVQQNAVQAYYLANVFREHLAQPAIDFRFHKNGVPDELIIETSDAGDTNNADMLTPRPGESPRMQMYLWSSADHRNVNGGDDASILWHEYAHGLTERTVVDADGWGALWDPQAWAMAEGWSDFFAQDLLVSKGLEVDSAQPGEIDFGAYVDRDPNASSATRFQAIDCSVGAPAAKCPAGAASGPGGFTYGDYGQISGIPDFPRPEPHADGEIWAQTLWDLRTAIGASEALRLIVAGLRLTTPEPTFLDGRNAILQADLATGGGWRTEIWRVFAARGMGVHASTASINRPQEDFTAVPDTTVVSGPPALSNQRTVAFTFSSTATEFECSLDASPFRDCVSGESWPVGEGTHTFVVRAVNRLGPDPTPATYAFRVDTTPPDTVITRGPPPILTARDFSVAFGATETATFVCSVDGGAAVPCASPFALTGLADGAHNVLVAATDAAGNTDPTPARSDFSVTIPTRPPAVAPTPTPTPAPKRTALTSASAPKTVSRTAGRVKVTLRGIKGARVAVQAKLRSRVVGKATKTLRASRLSFQLKLNKKRLKKGATVTVRVRATGAGLAAVTRTLKLRVR
jgi:hypothetical protein